MAFITAILYAVLTVKKHVYNQVVSKVNKPSRKSKSNWFCSAIQRIQEYIGHFNELGNTYCCFSVGEHFLSCFEFYSLSVSLLSSFLLSHLLSFLSLFIPYSKISLPYTFLKFVLPPFLFPLHLQCSLLLNSLFIQNSCYLWVKFRSLFT